MRHKKKRNFNLTKHKEKFSKLKNVKWFLPGWVGIEYYKLYKSKNCRRNIGKKISRKTSNY